MLLAPEDFASKWGMDALVQPPAASMPGLIPSDARAFLLRAGLPALIRYFGGSTDCKITFCLPREWSVYWGLGDEFFCNGAAWWCIHERTGHIDRIDIELANPIEFVNSSVAHFASAVLAALWWSNRRGLSAKEWPSEVDQFKQELAVIDPASMESHRNFWPVYLDFIREEGSPMGAFEKGTRLEGERALRTGPS